MTTIVAGTNRSGSNTKKIALAYQRLLEERGVATHFFSLEGEQVWNRDARLREIEEKIILPTSQFIFIVPEYNGSFPGVLKMLFDNSSSHEIWYHKKALLTGLATGRAGNLRGMDHLADILNFVKITVHPNKLPLSQVNRLIDAGGQISDPGTLAAIRQQLDEFLSWIKY